MRWLPIAEVEAMIGKKERNARYWLDRHEIPARGERPKLFSERAILAALAGAGQQPRKTPERPPEQPPEYPPETAGTPPEPIEAAYRVAGEAVAEVALVPLATMVEELRGLADQLADLARRNEGLALEVGTLRERQVGHEGQIAARDQTISTQAEALASQTELIGELRRRAESAEAELSRRREEEAGAAALLHRRIEQERRNRAGMQDAQDGAGPQGAPEEAPGGVWGRLRRWWRG